MTARTLSLPLRAAAPFPDLFDDLRVAWRTFRQRRADRAALVRARRLGPRLLADMGIPAEAVPGWDELTTNGFLIQRRR